ncbi:MAG: Glu/Leu/Phe/Val dehydrogenase [Candidatus Saccharimonadales bacterium]
MGSMLRSAEATVKRAAQRLKLSEAQTAQLLTPEMVHSFELSVNGKTHRAYRVQHSSKRGPYKGGIRFHGAVDEEEVRALALLMSLKTAAAGIPMGGGKGGVAFDPREHDQAHIEAVSRAYAQHLLPHIGPHKDVPGPDVGTPSEVLDWMADEFEKHTGDTSKAAFTGKTVGKGGSLGREQATGRGGMIVLREYLKSKQVDPKTITVAVQGVGNVGFWFAKLAEEKLGVRVVAVSDSKRTLVIKNFTHNRDGLSLEEYNGHKHGLIEDLDNTHTEFLERDAVLSLPVDILVLAALGDVVVEDNVSTVQAKIILELANGPVTDAAHENFLQRGREILPDVVSNAGGVVVSYLEWLQNLAGEAWSERKVNTKLNEILSSATQRMLELAKKEHISFKDAATILALQELLQDKR